MTKKLTSDHISKKAQPHQVRAWCPDFLEGINVSSQVGNGGAQIIL